MSLELFAAIQDVTPRVQMKKLAKSENSAIAAAAKEVVESWKDSVKRDQAATQAAADATPDSPGNATANHCLYLSFVHASMTEPPCSTHICISGSNLID